MGQLLENKNAIVYGASGGIGRGVARTFARHGATVFLAGRTRERLDAVAKDITAEGGQAEVAVVDAVDEHAVDEHARSIAERAGSIDVSVNLISHGDQDAGGYLQGVPIVEMPVAAFTRPVQTAVLANLLTARAAARHMVEQGSGVILTLTNAGSRSGAPLMGSTGVAAAAIETFSRYLAAEVGPQGVRVLGLHIAAVPETFPQDIHTDVFDDPSRGPGGGMDAAGLEQMLAQMTMLRRVTTVANVADVVAFLASDWAGGMTATILNVTGGMVHD